MKRFLAVVACCVVMTSAGTAGGFGLGAHGGVSFSSFPKQISDFYGTGFGFGAHGELGILPFLSTRLNFDYWTFSSDKTKLLAALQPANPGLTDVTGLNISTISIYLDGKGKIPLGGTVTPYGLLGLGMNFTSTSTLEGTANGQAVSGAAVESSSDFGINFGAGADFAIGVINLFGEVRYVLIFSSGESSGHIPIVVGATFGI
ncbi:MAG: porin family protein [Ignavibacteria bacterium]|nr:porin family protein [Ignavibacteria bacterium]